MSAVTVSAAYGTGGSVIARGLAERLGVPLLDRAISSQVAERLHVSVDEAVEGTRRRSLAEKFFGSLASMSGAVVGVDDEQSALASGLVADNAQVFRQSADRIMLAAIPAGVVILGRGGAASLHGRDDVVSVRLYGQRERRIAHAAEAEGVDVETATRRLAEVDKARAHYVRRLYNRDIDDPELYDLQVDSTLVPASTCIEIIAAVLASVQGAAPRSDVST